MIDVEKVKSFWKTRSEKWNKIPFESIANLEEKDELLKLKMQLEQEKIMPLLPLHKDTLLLDLGAGTGQWAFRFAPFIKKVIAVEYVDTLAEIGRIEAKNRQINNVEFITSAAENYQTDQQFNIIFISGLFVYLHPAQAEQLMANLSRLLRKDGLILLRDGTSILQTSYFINNQHSTILGESYSAFYRTRNQYITLFEENNFLLKQDNQMFDENCPLNKFAETRLWYYLFCQKG